MRGQPRGPTFSASLNRIFSAALPIELTKVEFPMVRADSVDPGISEFECEPIIRRFTIGADLVQDLLQKLATECHVDAHAALLSVRAPWLPNWPRAA